MIVAVIDYEAGNVKSVCNALDAVGQQYVFTADPDELKNVDGIILPGVGAFQKSMGNLRRTGMEEALNEAVIRQGKPYLGICLGMQFLATKGYEHGEYDGLGWIGGSIELIRPSEPKFRIPHIGWNDLQIRQTAPLFEGVEDPTYYFVHSFHFAPDEASESMVSATCEHGGEVTASVQRDNIFGVQFHPEKSQKAGLTLLENFFNFIKAS